MNDEMTYDFMPLTLEAMGTDYNGATLEGWTAVFNRDIALAERCVKALENKEGGAKSARGLAKASGIDRNIIQRAMQLNALWTADADALAAVKRSETEVAELFDAYDAYVVKVGTGSAGRCIKFITDGGEKAPAKAPAAPVRWNTKREAKAAVADLGAERARAFAEAILAELA